MDEDVDFSGWELPPLEDDPDREPPPERPPYSGVSIGSDLAGLQYAGSGVLDLGEYVCNDLVSARPTVVALARLDFQPRRATPARGHRGLKHQAGWQVRRNPDGTTTWTSPQGREYTNHPPARWKVPGEKIEADSAGCEADPSHVRLRDLDVGDEV